MTRLIVGKQMAHRHPDLPDYCTVCDPPRRSASEWFLLIVSAVVLAGMFFVLGVAAFVALAAS